jgi:hypothetical protein
VAAALEDLGVLAQDAPLHSRQLHCARQGEVRGEGGEQVYVPERDEAAFSDSFHSTKRQSSLMKKKRRCGLP